MQIRYDTAHAMGYAGLPRGLLDAETNLKYAVPYLANAFIVAEGDERLALRPMPQAIITRRNAVACSISCTPPK